MVSKNKLPDCARIERKVRHDGIRIDNDLYDSLHLAFHVGDTVLCDFATNGDRGVVAVYDVQGVKICDARLAVVSEAVS